MRFLLLFWFAPHFLMAQTYSGAVASAGLPGHHALGSAGALSVFANPAMLHDRGAATIAFGASRPFGLPGVRTFVGATSLSATAWTVGAGYVMFGNELYRDRVLAIAIARRLSSRVLAGLAASHHHVAIAGYPAVAGPALHFGFRIRVPGNLEAGFLYRNLVTQLPFRDAFDAAPELFTTLRLTMFAQTAACLELRHVSFAEPGIHMGVETAASSSATLYFGWELEPAAFSAGFRLALARVGVHYGFRYLDPLGSTHAFGMSLRRGKP